MAAVVSGFAAPSQPVALTNRDTCPIKRLDLNCAVKICGIYVF